MASMLSELDITEDIEELCWEQLSADENTKIHEHSDSIQEVEIATVAPGNAGVYTCMVTMETGASLTTTGKLTVTEPTNNGAGAPVFTRPLTEQHVRDGDQVTLECEVTGNPRPQVSWFKGTVEILDSQDFQITNIGNKCCLQFMDIFPEDEGKYSCRASNSAGEATTSCHVLVD
ncbi:MYLK-like protein, partial [Mya arenaria]